MNNKKEQLDFSNQKLKEFPPEIFSTKRLKKLSLKNNQIKKIPIDIASLKHLETLDLSGNQISNLFAKLFELRSLRILILDKNQIVSIPKQINKLGNLKILSFSNNKLTELPEEIKELRLLEELNISSNSFTRFPWQVLSLSKLSSLWVSKNSFEDFPASEIRTNLRNLKRLYCYGYEMTDIDSINKSYVQLSKIKGNCINFLSALETSLAIGSKSVRSGIDNKDNHSEMVLKRQIFISYSHSDKKWLDLLIQNLRVLNMEGIEFDTWSDTKIRSGKMWKEEISKALDESYISILLISTAFLGSEFIRTNELPILLKNAEARGTKILPLLISPSRFTKTKMLSDFQSVNDPNEPLSECNDSKQQRILLKLMDDVENYITEYSASSVPSADTLPEE